MNPDMKRMSAITTQEPHYAAASLAASYPGLQECKNEAPHTRAHCLTSTAICLPCMVM